MDIIRALSLPALMLIMAGATLYCGFMAFRDGPKSGARRHGYRAKPDKK